MKRSAATAIIILWIMVQWVSVTFAAESQLPAGFVYLSEVAPDIRVELRYCTSENFLGQPVRGYQASRCIITQAAAAALKRVQDELKSFNLGLKVFDAYRPQQAVDHFVEWAKDIDDNRMKQIYYPQVDKQNLFRDGYIADKSGHSRGSALDLTIISLGLPPEPEAELDMGSRFDFFGPESWPDNPRMTAAQRSHRMLLQTVMKKHGFEPYDKEWWHFKLKDEPFPTTWFNFPVQ